MEQINLVIIDGTNKLQIVVNKSVLSVKCDYFKNLFTKFKESTMSEITIEVPDAIITMVIVMELLGNIIKINVNKSVIDCYDFLSLKYNHLLDSITDIEELLNVVDKHGYTEDNIKILAKKIPVRAKPDSGCKLEFDLPANYDMVTFPVNLKQLLNYYKWIKPLIVFTSGNKVIVRDLETNTTINIFKEHNEQVLSAIITTDNKYIVSTSNTNIIISVIDTGVIIKKIKMDSMYRTTMVTTDNKYIVTRQYNGTVNLYELMTGNLIHSYYIESSIRVILSRDNKYIIIGTCHDEIKICEVETGKVINKLYQHSTRIASIAITSNNKYIVSGSWDKAIKIWNLETRQLLNTIIEDAAVQLVAITSDDKYIVSYIHGYQSLKIWELSTGQMIHVLSNNDRYISSIVTRDKYIYCGYSNGEIKIWETGSWKLIGTLEGYNEDIISVTVTYPVEYPKN